MQRRVQLIHCLFFLNKVQLMIWSKEKSNSHKEKKEQKKKKKNTSRVLDIRPNPHHANFRISVFSFYEKYYVYNIFTILLR